MAGRFFGAGATGFGAADRFFGAGLDERQYFPLNAIKSKRTPITSIERH
ncbi:hypothetical protein [Sporosarcina cyprini]|nr:hypothetical protein [Sporosarcina cyprini]MCG3087083.1 hypothetical protein [Sporosarcina cyprini]